MNAVDKHPQKDDIIRRILTGEPLRSVAATINPPLHHATLARYRILLLGNATRKMRGSSSEALALKTLAASHGDDSSVTALQSKLREELQQVVVDFSERREKWISDAEKRAVLSKSGEPIRDSDGSVVRDMDHRALSSHDRNNLSALELRAKLAGLLQDGAGVAATVQFAIVMPPTVTVAGQAAPAEAAIEITATR